VSFIDLSQTPTREVIDGYNARMVHSPNMTLVYWDIKAGHPMPEHDHPHEQIANVLEGRFELTVEGKTRVLTPGMVVVIPANARHSGRSLTDCRLLDVFHPVREDLR